jgi:hypothetical protein
LLRLGTETLGLALSQNNFEPCSSKALLTGVTSTLVSEGCHEREDQSDIARGFRK